MIDIRLRTLLLFLFIYSAGFAQLDNPERYKNSELKQFYRSAYRANDYYSQIDYLEELVKRKEGKLNFNYQLARAYHLSRNFQKALEQYSLAYYGDQQKYAVSLFHMARIMKTQEQYKFALLYLERFEKENKGKKHGNFYKKLVKSERLGCELALAEDSSTARTDVNHLENGINMANIEFSPFIIDSTEFWYVSLKSDTIVFKLDEEHTKIPERKIYKAKKQQNDWHDQGLADMPLNDLTDRNIGSFTISEDGNRIYFTDCKPNWKNQIRCQLFVLKKENGLWSSPQELHPEINSAKFTNTHPTVGKSAKPDREIIYFVSDRHDGKGGLDIWYTRYRLSKDKFDKPRNCGTKINTQADEMAPNFDNKAYRLYFASAGWPSIGGLDIQYASGERSKWSGKAVNAGKQVNTSLDDLYYMPFKNRKNALIVSNRTGSISLKHPHCCDDLYELKWKNIVQHKLTGHLINKETNADLDSVEVRLILKNKEDGEEYIADKVYTDEKGNYDLLLDQDMDYKLVFHKKNFFNETDSFTTRQLEKNTSIKKDNRLTPFSDAEIVIPNIYYAFDDASLSEKAQIAIDTSIYDLLINNPTLIVELASHTDSKGTHGYNAHLSQQRAESVVNYLRKKGIDKRRIQGKGYGETKPVAPNVFPDGTDNPKGRAKNRRTSFRVIGELSYEILYEEE